VLGAITGLASMLPVVGSALVWGPIATGLFLSGHVLRGALLVAVGVGLISVADNLLQPLYARVGSLRMPTSLLYVAVFGGLLAFGTWGALLGPLVLRLWLEALAIDRELRASVSAERAP
jgi:predicted PurR-regulated permease PerM